MKPYSLEEAAEAAVNASTAEMSRIAARVERLIDLLRESAEKVRSSGLENSRDDLVDRFSSQLNETVAKVRDLFERQCAALKTFNIVLFGRTGTGKSTLISAMTRGNGESVSQGESDWTTRVTPLDWRSCRIYDTPGINGWGRIESRSNLEARAREAVEVADFVLVCFDSQSQQADEFRKLAAWVQTYRKPVIAVLNSRNPVWRFPPRVPMASARSNLSRAVREHADNIRDELAKIGLPAVPVVALSAKRALFARASLPFRGPDELSLWKQRAEFGVDQLEDWSNFPRLEKLLVETISHHAVPLRLGALNDQLGGVLSELATGLGQIEGEARQAAETIEKTLIDPLLRLFGYPPGDDQERRRPLISSERDLLHELERCRKGAFQTPVEGEFFQFVQQRLDAELGSLRSRSLQNAEECVMSAFKERSRLSEKEMWRKSFNEDEMKRTAECVLKEGAEFLEKRAGLAYRDTALDLRVHAYSTAVQGDAGSILKYSSRAIRVGGILTGAVGALGRLAITIGRLAITNSWNPLGWAAGVAASVALVGSVAASVLHWLGSKARKKAEKKYLAARSQALAEARRNVHDVYDSFRDQVLTQAHQYAVEVSGKVLKPPIEQALLLRNVQSHCAMLQREIDRLTNDLPDTSNPQTLLWNTASEIEVEAYPKDAHRSRLYWLGEDWISDPIGLKQQEGATEARRTPAYDPGFFDQLFEGLKHSFDRITEDLKPGAGRKWLEGVLQRCTGDPAAREAFADLVDIADDGRPIIYLVGDYNAGKSSFIKRLLLDAGSPVPPDLEIRGNPATDRAREYDWGGIRLVDTPGFQSGQKAHTDHTLRTLLDASAVIYLFQPNLVLGDDRHLTTVLRGNRELGIVPKQGRTFFVINRSDELGVDPETDPDEYQKLADRKRTELSLALSSRGISVDPNAIFCMASDPFGLVGNRVDVNASAFDPYRTWDGFDRFMAEFRRSRGSLLRVGVDRSVLEGGIARLARLQALKIEEIGQLTDQDGAIGRLEIVINEAICEGVRLGAKHRADLERLLNDHAARFRDEVLAEEDLEQLTFKAERLQQWWKDEALQVELDQWAKETSEALNAWRKRRFEAINRRLDSAEFRAAFGDHAEPAPDIPDAKTGKPRSREAFGMVSRVMGGATRDVVYQIGKGLGFKFKPWGAIKCARALGMVSAVMAVVGLASDVVELVRDERRRAEQEKEAARRKFAAFLRESVAHVVKTVAEGSEEEPGILRTLEAVIQDLREWEDELSKERACLADQLAEARERLQTYSAMQAEACTLLGNPWR